MWNARFAAMQATALSTYAQTAIMDRHRIGTAPENIQQVCEDAFEMLKEMKKRYMKMNQSLERVVV